MVQQQLSLETGNVILLKDLSNIMTDNKQGKSRNDVHATVQTLMDKLVWCVSSLGQLRTVMNFAFIVTEEKREVCWFFRLSLLF